MKRNQGSSFHSVVILPYPPLCIWKLKISSFRIHGDGVLPLAVEREFYFLLVLNITRISISIENFLSQVYSNSFRSQKLFTSYSNGEKEDRLSNGNTYTVFPANLFTIFSLSEIHQNIIWPTLIVDVRNYLVYLKVRKNFSTK